MTIMARKTPRNLKRMQQPAILPLIPSQIAGKAFYAARSFQAHHTDNAGIFTDTYTTTGLFPDPQNTQARSALYKALTVFFDLDLTDLFLNEETLEKAIAELTAQGVSTVYRTASGQGIDITDMDATDTKARDHVIKAWLTAKTQDDLMELVEEAGTTFVDQLIAIVGKPNMITYSGTGLHVHYHIAETEGWTETGLAQVDANEAINLVANRNEFVTAYKKINSYIKSQNDGVCFDNKCSDVGTCVTRDVESTNSKHSKNIKTVTVIMAEKCDPSRTITLADFDQAPQAERKTSSSSRAAQRVKDAKGKTFDKRVKRSPARLKANANVSYQNAAGEVVTVTVDELYESWDELKEAGIVQDDNGDKIKVRLDWLSNGSINAYARRIPTESHDKLVFICDVEKYLDADARNVEEKDGKLVGKWLYEGSLRSGLRFSDKGALLGMVSNYIILLQLCPETANGIRLNTRTEDIEVSAQIHRDHQVGNQDVQEAANANDWFPINDAHLLHIKGILERFYTKSLNKEDVYGAIQSVAGLNGYDDVRAWVDSLSWDGKQRLDGDDAWLCNFMGIRKEEGEIFEYYEMVGRNWINAIVRNIYAIKRHPAGTQHMTLMRGPQSFGKSTLAQIIAGTKYIGNRYYGELGDKNLLNKGQGDIIQVLRGKTCVELPELAAFSKKEVDLVKNFITQEVLEGRLAYGRLTTRMQKDTYCIGTTNRFKPLNDPTGNRRFLMVDLYTDFTKTHTGRHAWDLKGLNALVPQLYAEAYQRVVAGQHIPANRQEHTVEYCGTTVERWNLTPKEIEMLNRKNMQYTNENAVTEAVYDILDTLVADGHILTNYKTIRDKLKNEYYINVNGNTAINEALAQRNWKYKKVQNRRVFEYQGKVAEEAAYTSVTTSGSIPTPDANAGNSEQLTKLMQMFSELKEECAALRRENKELRDELANASKPARKEPRRTAPKKAKKPVVKVEEPVEMTIDIALEVLRNNGQGNKAERYESLSDDQATRKRMLGAALIQQASALV